VVAWRRERLLAVERETARAYGRQLVGRRLGVLVEGADPARPGLARGTSCRSVPVRFPGDTAALLRQVVPVRVTGVLEDGLVGEAEGGPAGRLPLPLAGAAYTDGEETSSRDTSHGQ
jgi:tRNA A37 methylthiotransferase MiaB